MPEPILLITSPSIFLLDERVFLSLGILKVAASLESRGHKVEAVDLSGVANYEEAIRDHIASTSAKVVGITATTPQMPAAKKIVDVIRASGRPFKIILGGPHATLVHAAFKRECKDGRRGRATEAIETLLKIVDVVVAGDGEDAIFAALRTETGVVDADDPKGTLFLTNKRLEETPLPARHLVDMESYHYKIDGAEACHVIAQLGCPFACSFCAGRNSPSLRRIRTRSTESVVREIEHLHTTYGYRGFNLFDDELNVNKQMVGLMNGIADLAERLGTEFRLRGFVKSELFTDEQAAAMYRAGFRWVLCGYESGSPRILENINKKATREDNDECVGIARRNGLKVKALMSIGHPGESRETVAETEDWLLSTKPDDFDVTIITPYPGCPYYDEAEETSSGIWTYTCPKNGDRLHAVAIDYNVTADYYKGAPGEYAVYVYTDHLNQTELGELRDGVESHVRATLGIPFNQSAASLQYEHSMGMTLPPSILRSSNP